MTSRSCKKSFSIVLLGIFFVHISIVSIYAANISEFFNIEPYAEIEGVYDDNVFELSEDAPLPEDAEEREDMYVNATAGVGADITLERPLLTLGVGLDYSFTYAKYRDNTEQDGAQNSLDFDFLFLSKIEEEIGRDRLKLNLNDSLSLIPLDEEEPLLQGNLTIRNIFEVGALYKLIATPRISLDLGYSYSRTDYQEDDPIEVETIPDQFEDSSDLTQESQTHTGIVDLSYDLNSKLKYVLTYNYQFTPREENSGELLSANFTRQHVLSGIQAKLTPRIHSNFQAGYTFTSYDDVDGLSQDDQESVVAEASITANFARQPQMQLGYRRYYIENDFGNTLLTDNLFARVGMNIIPGFTVDLSGDYILEDRDLLGDETTQLLIGVDTEYEFLKNMMVLASYSYRNKDFFEESEADREDTTHLFSGGIQYKISRYFLMKGMYYYTDQSSNIDDNEFSQNRFVAGGKVVF